MAKPHNVFRVRLNCVDHYQAAPSSLDPPIWGVQSVSFTQRSSLPQIPVIRVFGATETGQKVCAHIHGAFPYLYVPYAGSLDQEHVDQYVRSFRHSTDHALALSYRRNPYSDPRNAQFVAHISLVKGVPFFGYHVGYEHYLKVYLLNPSHMTRFTDLLQQGAILQRAFQPYEAHLQYLLQWMCDFNLYGCAYVETDKPHFRAPIPDRDESTEMHHLGHDRPNKPRQILDEERYPRQSHCELELDIRVEDILNRHSVRPRDLHHSFVERLSSMENLPPEEKLVHSMSGLWKDETRRRKKRMGLSDTASSPFPPDVLVSMSADPRNEDNGGWIHEEEFRKLVEKLAEEEKKARGGGELTFESFVGPKEKPEEGEVQTVLESVGDLFRERLRIKYGDVVGQPSQNTTQDSFRSSEADTASIEGPLVDMIRIEQVAEDEDYGSDEDIARTKALTQRQKLKDAGVGDAMGEAKVRGDADKIKADAERVDSEVEVPSETIKKAERDDLKRPAPKDTQGPFKRPKPNGESERPPSRHVSFRVKDVRPSKVAKSEAPSSDYDPPNAAQARPDLHSNSLDAVPSGQPPPPSSQRSAQSQGSQSQRLSFPTAKDEDDPHTKLRLSQQDGEARKRLQSSPKGSERLYSGLSHTSASKDSSESSSQTSRKTTVSPRLARDYVQAFDLSTASDVFVFGHEPPSLDEVEATVQPQIIYQDAYYSDEKDVPERPREYAGQEFKLGSNTLPYLPNFEKDGTFEPSKGIVLDKAKEELLAERQRRQCTLNKWEILEPPPSFDEVQQWLNGQQPTIEDDPDQLEFDAAPSGSQIKRKNRPAPELSQIDGPTQKNKHGFKYSQHKVSSGTQHETGYMSTMSLEVHANSRGDLAPDPEKDEITMIVWCLADEQSDDKRQLGITVLETEDDDETPNRIRRIVGNAVQVDIEDNELDLLNRLVDIVRAHDPDILTGYEVHNSSWGYLIERARLQYEFNLPDEFSRMKSQSHGRFGKEADRWGFTHTSTVRITGRHTINIWRAMRSELNLLQYTMENVVFHLLQRRIPHYTFATLTKWYQSKRPRDLARVLDYVITRTKLDLEILDTNELIPRTSEQARLLGVDFFSVFSRGSQFKVESLMFRIAKPESFVLVSPSRKQVGAQNALECLPLVMEPQSAFYNSPLLVLDFQSLYPSVMIAYNYCYSTCLGRIVNWRGTNKLGFDDFERTPGLLELVKDKVNISPNGLMYVKPSMRKSLLAKMLGEILETRLMVKSGMKVDKDDKTLQQLLNNRQLALKLIANVTYGYTSASFSGRMPCSEIADSIVQTGRETLEKAIALIHSVSRWGAEVVYGDTDSLFISLPGRTRDAAHKIGDEIAAAVTDANPRPIKLKFEKVYHPCILLAKKRYVGFKYESPSQQTPDFDAKGIETVRRDGTPAEQKIEEKALKLLFRTADLSQVKRYFQAQCTKILTNKVSVQDFCFAKEVKLGSYAERGPPPPGALIASKRMLRNPRAEPQYGERVPYVVVAGAPGARLWERCVEPEELVKGVGRALDAEYYISKNLIPPLERIFCLVGANVRGWWESMPKVRAVRGVADGADGEGTGKGKRTMESYMGSSSCVVCRTRLTASGAGPVSDAPKLPLCEICREKQPQASLRELRAQVNVAEARVRDVEAVCRDCAGLAWGEDVKCDSRDCPVFYSRVKAGTKLGVARAGVGKVLGALEEEVEDKWVRGLEW